MPRKIEYAPFCSKRCADLDLGRWFKEEYRIPSENEEGLGEEPEDAETNEEQSDDEEPVESLASTARESATR